MELHYPASALALAFVSGIAFSGVGIGYLLGRPHGISAGQVAFAICFPGVAFFGLLSRSIPLSTVPRAVWVVALLAGGGQYIALKMIGLALARGPLSPPWCTANLNFVLTIAYARLFLGEAIPAIAYAGIAAAVACVLVASLGMRPDSPTAPSRRRPLRARLAYATILLVLLVTNALWIMGIKHLSGQRLADGQSYLSVYANCYGLGVYVVLGLLLLADMLIVRRALPRLGPWAAVGAFAATGSVGGLWALNVAAVLPAAVVMPINSVMSLLTAAIVSVLAFGERRSPAWYATIALAVGAVVLVNAGGARG